MSPRKGTGHPGNNGGGRELQALLDSTVVRIVDKDDAAGQIPWRTSRRLQEATLRSLTKERDVDNVLCIKKEKESPEPFSVRSLKRLRSPPSPTTPLDLCKSEELDDGEGSGSGSGESCLNDGTSKKGIIVNGEITRSSKRKRRRVHFADPLIFYIEDSTKQVETVVRKPAAEKKSAQQARNENARSPAKLGGGTQHQPSKQPMSCFDLLCNYAGTKGWRCYRIRMEGECFCSYHISSQKAAAPSIVRISLCT